jgi:hypothetical protein
MTRRWVQGTAAVQLEKTLEGRKTCDGCKAYLRELPNALTSSACLCLRCSVVVGWELSAFGSEWYLTSLSRGRRVATWSPATGCNVTNFLLLSRTPTISLHADVR